MRRLFLAISLLTVAASAQAALAQSLPLDNPWLERRPLNIAHQGGEIEAPSNTLYAFKTALRKGADVLETDVHLTADGQVVAIHDETVDRTTNGTGSVEDKSVAQLKALDAAYWFVPGEGTTHEADRHDYVFRGVATRTRRPPRGFGANDFTIPTLEELLKTFPHTFINLELKPTARMTGRLEAEVARLLEKYGRTDDVIVVSFIDQSVEVFKALAPDVDTAAPTGQVAAFWASSQGPGTGTPNPQHVALQVPVFFQGIRVVSADFIADAHANRLAVHVWTINDPHEMSGLLAIGADGVMTDRPTVLERILRARAGSPH
jgi:glycerophosphoryl diester phosphodiesterase